MMPNASVDLLLPLCRHRAGRRLSGAVASAAGARTCRRRCRTWEESKLYILEPFDKRGEMDQGIVLLAYYSLVRVAQGLPARHR